MRQFEVLLGEWEGNKETLMRKLQPMAPSVPKLYPNLVWHYFIYRRLIIKTVWPLKYCLIEAPQVIEIAAPKEIFCCIVWKMGQSWGYYRNEKSLSEDSLSRGNITEKLMHFQEEKLFDPLLRHSDLIAMLRIIPKESFTWKWLEVSPNFTHQ